MKHRVDFIKMYTDCIIDNLAKLQNEDLTEEERWNLENENDMLQEAIRDMEEYRTLDDLGIDY